MKTRRHMKRATVKRTDAVQPTRGPVIRRSVDPEFDLTPVEARRYAWLLQATSDAFEIELEEGVNRDDDGIATPLVGYVHVCGHMGHEQGRVHLSCGYVKLDVLKDFARTLLDMITLAEREQPGQVSAKAVR